MSLPGPASNDFNHHATLSDVPPFRSHQSPGEPRDLELGLAAHIRSVYGSPEDRGFLVSTKAGDFSRSISPPRMDSINFFSDIPAFGEVELLPYAVVS